MAGYALIVVAFWLGQRSLLYPVPPPQSPALEGGALVRVPIQGGGEAFAFYVPASPGGPTVAYFHGNGSQVANRMPLASQLREAGIGFFGVEYPGYGPAPGEPTESGIYETSEAALKWLRAQGVANSQLILFGRSLGSGVATEMARRGYGSRTLLVSPYTSIADVAQHLYPFLPAQWLVTDRYDSLARAPELRMPVLILHGTADTLIPFEIGERLARAFPSAVLVPVEGAGHDDILERPEVRTRILEFVRP